MRKFREWGNGALLYLDFGGGYTTMHVLNFIKLCTKRYIFLYIIYFNKLDGSEVSGGSWDTRRPVAWAII